MSGQVPGVRATLLTGRARNGTRQGEAHPLARQLRGERVGAGLTQTDVARLVGVTTGSISGYENGQREPSLEVLARWASALGFRIVLVQEGEVDDE